MATKKTVATAASAKPAAPAKPTAPAKPVAPAKPAKPAKKTDLLHELLADVNEKFHIIGELIVEMQAHGDLHDGHVDLAKNARKLAKQAHATVKAIRKGE